MTAACPRNVCANGHSIGDVELHRAEPPSPVPLEKGRELRGSDIGQGHRGDRRVLQQIVRAGAALEPGAEDKQFHTDSIKSVQRIAPEDTWEVGSASMAIGCHP